MVQCMSSEDAASNHTLVGLPASHFSYVRNIQTGLPVFLFGYNDRTLHGIYEAASPGQMNIDPYAWTDGGRRKTKYPAQVHICVRLECHPLSENQFRDILSKNYYSPKQFHFELDHAQVDGLIMLFKKSATTKTITRSVFPRNTSIWVNGTINNGSNDHKLSHDLAAIDSSVTSSFSIIQEMGELNWAHVQQNTLYESESVKDVPEHVSFGCGTVKHVSSEGSSIQQKQTVEKEFSGSTEERERLNQLKESVDSCFLSSTSSMKNEDCEFPSAGIIRQEHIEFPEKPKDALLGFEYERSLTQEVLYTISDDMGAKDLWDMLARNYSQVSEARVHSQEEIPRSKMQVELESQLVMTTEAVDHLLVDVPDDTTTSCFEEAIYLIGGYDGTSWLPKLDLYAPKCSSILSLPSMSSPRSYAGVVSLHGCIYAIGGGVGSSWYDTVECYNPSNQEWSRCPPLSCQNVSLAAASLNDKIFVLGGSDGIDSFSGIEMYDPILGKWIVVGSMLHERFSHAAAELGNAVYVVGGYDGKEYLRSVERYDPREVSCTRLDPMSSRRGCSSLVVLNEKLYALGGYDGNGFLSSVEMFDPRNGSWTFADPMNTCRGYSAAVTLSDSMYIMGGIVDEGQHVSDTAEYYREGAGWKTTGSKVLGRRCLHSAAVL
ncbi:unnamed protein product [Victoria cruziana]